jgi:hypothetical protein
VRLDACDRDNACSDELEEAPRELHELHPASFYCVTTAGPLGMLGVGVRGIDGDGDDFDFLQHGVPAFCQAAHDPLHMTYDNACNDGKCDADATSTKDA